MESQAMNQTSIETRSFHYGDSKSDKFWMITLENNQHTVQYGRTGTQGQQQTKEFPTVEKARQSYEKLIREKMAKGYVEEQTQSQAIAQRSRNGIAATSSSETAISPPAVTVPTIENAEAIDSFPYLQQPAKSDLQKSIDLDPKDWFWATWRNLEPLERSPIKPFNQADCMARLQKAQDGQAYAYQWRWWKAKIAPSLSPEEAHFWFTAVVMPMKSFREEEGQVFLKSEDLINQISQQTFDGNLSPEQIRQSLSRFFDWSRSTEEIFPIINLLPIEDFIDLGQQTADASVFMTFRFYILPYLSEVEIERLRSHLRNRFKAAQPGAYSPADCYFAAYLGMHEELLPLIESWSDDAFTKQSYFNLYHRPQEIIFGLRDPHLVEHHIQRLNLTLSSPVQGDLSTYIRAWLAHTEYTKLDLIRDTILAINHQEMAKSVAEEFALVKAPEAAPFMLELMLSSKATQVARRWLQDNPEHAIAGLIPLTAGRGKLADAAIEFLQTMKRKGYISHIQTCIENESAEVAARIRSAVLDSDSKEYIPFDSHTNPDWLQQISTSTKSTKKTSWTVSPTELPPIAIGDYCLNSEQIEAILNALRQSKLGSPHPLITAVQTQIDRTATDAFAWRLFELWLKEGALSKENWAMQAVGLLGSNASALKLAPLIREWPGESQHQRAVMGLECLRSIGTDTALMQISGIAQKVKFKGIKQRAQDCMEAIAQDRHMAREQLEDRIVPDCELDARGSRLFDFGARQFRFVLGADLKPMVKDAAGKVKPNLPNPTTKDDREKAQAAIDDWKLFKKQVSEVIKIQPTRLEQAMVMGRRWQVNEFELLLVQHPLMTHLTQRLIWGGYDISNQLIATFRVTEDQTYADSNDETFDMTKIAQVSIVHPLHLAPEVRSTWGELLSDYEIVQPFVQLGRSLHRLEPGEETALEIARFKNLKVPIVALVRTLENLGWQRGVLHDHGDYSLHFKYFSAADITAVVGEYEEVFVDLSVIMGSGLEDIDRCCFCEVGTIAFTIIQLMNIRDIPG
ncbi:MAG: DUF4132 domain-containing protein [Leptolyngbyaceae cyanobacterium SM1_3_5]|nr:DUF4132 domain-containing protein [Leptolyngbyaceae cyanobacterium SM1_3_5]